MEGFDEFAIQLDKTIKKIQLTYLGLFKEKNIDLTIEQWVILRRIHELGEEASQSEISKTNYRNRATTSRVISGLCKKGIINKERFEGDLKRFKLTITPLGLDLVNQILPDAKRLRLVGYENINPQEFEIFLKVTKKIWTNYDNYEVDE